MTFMFLKHLLTTTDHINDFKRECLSNVSCILKSFIIQSKSLDLLDDNTFLRYNDKVYLEKKLYCYMIYNTLMLLVIQIFQFYQFLLIVNQNNLD